jgi:hypothetical protein
MIGSIHAALLPPGPLKQMLAMNKTRVVHRCQPLQMNI